MKWLSLNDNIRATTPKLLCERITLLGGRSSDLEFVKNVLKQNRISDKQLLVLFKMADTLTYRKRRSEHLMDMDEWHDSGYNGHPGQYDGEGGFY